MDKVNLGSQIFVYPMPVAIIGVVVDEKPNFMTLAWLTRVNLDPPLIGVAINKTHHTAKGIRHTKGFSVNFPSQDLLDKTDFVGMASGKNIDKSALFDVFFGKTETIPLIEQCPLCLECRLDSIHEFPSNDFFVGEIIESYTEERFLSEGRLDMAKMKPLLLTMPDNSYWSVGEPVGRAWEAGRALFNQKE